MTLFRKAVELKVVIKLYICIHYILFYYSNPMLAEIYTEV